MRSKSCLAIMLAACLFTGCSKSNTADDVQANNTQETVNAEDQTGEGSEEAVNEENSEDETEEGISAEDEAYAQALLEEELARLGRTPEENANMNANKNTPVSNVTVTFPEGYVSAYDTATKPYDSNWNSRYDYAQLKICDDEYVYPMTLSSLINNGWVLEGIGGDKVTNESLDSYFSAGKTDFVDINKNGNTMRIFISNLWDIPVSLPGTVVTSLTFYSNDADFANTDILQVKDKSNNWTPVNQLAVKDLDQLLMEDKVEPSTYDINHGYHMEGHSVAYNFRHEENNTDQVREFTIGLGDYNYFCNATLADGREFIFADNTTDIVVRLSEGCNKLKDIAGPEKNLDYTEIMGKKYQIPYTVADLINSGDFTLSYAENETIAADKNGSCYLKMKDSNIDFRVLVSNNTKGEMKYQDCPVREISAGCINGNIYENDPSLTICGIPITSYTLANALEQYSQPDRIAYGTEYRYNQCNYDEQDKNSPYDHVSFEFEGQQLETMHVKYRKVR